MSQENQSSGCLSTAAFALPPCRSRLLRILRASASPVKYLESLRPPRIRFTGGAETGAPTPGHARLYAALVRAMRAHHVTWKLTWANRRGQTDVGRPTSSTAHSPRTLFRNRQKTGTQASVRRGNANKRWACMKPSHGGPSSRRCCARDITIFTKCSHVRRRIRPQFAGEPAGAQFTIQHSARCRATRARATIEPKPGPKPEPPKAPRRRWSIHAPSFNFHHSRSGALGGGNAPGLWVRG